MPMRDDPASPPALEELGFQYQPVAPISPGGLGWHEALVRWHLPDGTIRGPLEVLPYWLGPHRQPVFTRFTVDRAASRLRGDAHARLSIDLSPRQVTHPAARLEAAAWRSDVGTADTGRRAAPRTVPPRYRRS